MGWQKDTSVKAVVPSNNEYGLWKAIEVLKILVPVDNCGECYKLSLLLTGSFCVSFMLTNNFAQTAGLNWLFERNSINQLMEPETCLLK